MRKEPEPDPALDPFRGGVAVLWRDGELEGALVTNVHPRQWLGMRNDAGS